MSWTKFTTTEFLELLDEKFGSTTVSKDNLMLLRSIKISIPWKAWESKVTAEDGTVMYDVKDGLTNPKWDKPKTPKAKGAPAPKASLDPIPAPVAVESEAGVKAVIGSIENTVPNMTPGFVKWGTYEDIRAIIASRRFFPVFVTGLSGNGKTLNIKQACAESGRGFHRVNITIETSEDDLIGGFRLIDGDSVFEYGPVLKAMVNGDVLLLDEVDLGGPKLMTLQSVLEGNGYYIKKLGKWVYPAEGFTVIATANTKGKGSSDGSFQFTNVMNEAFLERFKITIEQPYPEVSDEKRILTAMLKTFTGVRKLGDEENKTVEMLAEWSGVIRESYAAGAIDSVISTRRNVIIAETFTIYNDIEKAVDLAIARFDEETQEAMKSAYRTVDARVAEKYARKEAEAARALEPEAEVKHDAYTGEAVAPASTEDEEFERMRKAALSAI